MSSSPTPRKAWGGENGRNVDHKGVPYEATIEVFLDDKSPGPHGVQLRVYPKTVLLGFKTPLSEDSPDWEEPRNLSPKEMKRQEEQLAEQIGRYLVAKFERKTFRSIQDARRAIFGSRARFLKGFSKNGNRGELVYFDELLWNVGRRWGAAEKAESVIGNTWIAPSTAVSADFPSIKGCKVHTFEPGWALPVAYEILSGHLRGLDTVEVFDSASRLAASLRERYRNGETPPAPTTCGEIQLVGTIDEAVCLACSKKSLEDILRQGTQRWPEPRRKRDSLWYKIYTLVSSDEARIREQALKRVTTKGKDRAEVDRTTLIDAIHDQLVKDYLVSMGTDGQTPTLRNAYAPGTVEVRGGIINRPLKRPGMLSLDALCPIFLEPQNDGSSRLVAHTVGSMMPTTWFLNVLKWDSPRLVFDVYRKARAAATFDEMDQALTGCLNLTVIQATFGKPTVGRLPPKFQWWAEQPEARIREMITAYREGTVTEAGAQYLSTPSHRTFYRVLAADQTQHCASCREGAICPGTTRPSWEPPRQTELTALWLGLLRAKGFTQNDLGLCTLARHPRGRAFFPFLGNAKRYLVEVWTPWVAQLWLTWEVKELSNRYAEPLDNGADHAAERLMGALFHDRVEKLAEVRDKQGTSSKGGIAAPNTPLFARDSAGCEPIPFRQTPLTSYLYKKDLTKPLTSGFGEAGFPSLNNFDPEKCNITMGVYATRLLNHKQVGNFQCTPADFAQLDTTFPSPASPTFWDELIVRPFETPSTLGKRNGLSAKRKVSTANISDPTHRNTRSRTN
ncbi:hypothetical protein DL769_004605 [Monosporascus sp. CRB-8-3]|nr:hypothetical protein DL769_004605 [Monosporascus sp. CRB-8-3]